MCSSAGWADSRAALRTDLDEVDLGEGLDGWGLDDVEDRDDVLVVEPTQQLDLAERAQAEHWEQWRGGGRPVSW